MSMEIKPRPYRDDADLYKMCALLQAGRAANNGTYYIHIGDLKWWLFYPAWEHDVPQHAYLWDDPANPERLLGWTLLSSHWGYLDVYVQPELRGTSQAEGIYTWAEQKLEAILRANHKDKFYVMWISQGDNFLNEHFRRRGLQRTPDDVVYMSRSLTGPLTEGPIPAGYTVRSSAGEMDARAWAKAQYGAFGSMDPMNEPS